METVPKTEVPQADVPKTEVPKTEGYKTEGYKTEGYKTEGYKATMDSPILQWSGQRRFKYLVTGVVGPIGCFVAAWCGLNARTSPLWQSGQLDVYLRLMLEPQALLPFIPLLAYSMLALGACCVNPQLAGKLWVRTGVYSGGILSIQYLIFVLFAGSFFPLLSAAVVGPSLALITYAAAKLMPQARRISIFQIMLLTTIVAFVAAFCAFLGPELFESDINQVAESAIASLFWSIVAVPFLNSLTYVRAAVALLRSPSLVSVSAGEKRNLMALAFGWLLGFGASWKFALDAMLAEYAKLPTSAPQCYISSAAACGHPKFVGIARFNALEKDSDSRAPYPLNAQMCRLKFLELALAAFSPGLHRLVRRAYDAVGPAAAAICRSNVWFADVSYIALKPVEFLAYLVQILSKVSSRQIWKLYTTARNSDCN